MQNLNEKLVMEIINITIATELRKLIVFLAEKGIYISDEVLDEYEKRLSTTNCSPEASLHLVEYYKNNNVEQGDCIQSLINKLNDIQSTGYKKGE